MFHRAILVALIAAMPSISWAQQPCTTDARRVVNELYRHMLERSVDASSQGWVDKLQNGMTVKELVRQIAKSPEHLQRFYNANEGAVANERAVATVYRHILGRQPDESGLRSYADMAADKGMPAVIDSIIASTEYRNNFGDWGVPGSGGVTFCGPNGR